MSDLTTIECKPSQWFKIRALSISVMLGFFALWFFKDGYWGYRDKNAEVVIKQVFLGVDEKPAEKADFVVRAADVFKKKEYTPETWAAFAKDQVVSIPEDKELLPRDYKAEKWPEEIVNGYEALKKGETSAMYELWKTYTNRTGLPITPSEKIYDADTIRHQYIATAVAGVLFLVAVFISLRTLGRSMKATPTGFSPAGGIEIPYSAMDKIDKRKWDTKGLAVIHYELNGKMKKAKVDGMVYGQFKVEDGAPGEALFCQIMDNFKGEVVEFISDDDDNEESLEAGVSKND